MKIKTERIRKPSEFSSLVLAKQAKTLVLSLMVCIMSLGIIAPFQVMANDFDHSHPSGNWWNIPTMRPDLLPVHPEQIELPSWMHNWANERQVLPLPSEWSMQPILPMMMPELPVLPHHQVKVVVPVNAMVRIQHADMSAFYVERGLVEFVQIPATPFGEYLVITVLPDMGYSIYSRWNSGNPVYSFRVAGHRVVSPVVVAFGDSIQPMPMPTFPPYLGDSDWWWVEPMPMPTFPPYLGDSNWWDNVEPMPMPTFPPYLGDSNWWDNVEPMPMPTFPPYLGDSNWWWVEPMPMPTFPPIQPTPPIDGVMPELPTLPHHQITVVAPVSARIRIERVSWPVGYTPVIYVEGGNTELLPIPAHLNEQIRITVLPDRGFSIDPRWNNGSAVLNFTANADRVVIPELIAIDSTQWWHTAPYHQVNITAPANARIRVERFDARFMWPVFYVERGRTEIVRLPLNQGNELIITVLPDRGFSVSPDWNNGRAIQRFAVNRHQPIAPQVVGSPHVYEEITTLPESLEQFDIIIVSPENGIVTVRSDFVEGVTTHMQGEIGVHRLNVINNVIVTVVPESGWEIHPDWNNGEAEYSFFVSEDYTIRPLLRRVRPSRPIPPLPSEQYFPRFISGDGNGTVRPDGFVTRAEMAQMFFNLIQDPARNIATMGDGRFTDVSSSDWYYRAIAYFVNRGALTGFADGSFRPHELITNAEFAAFATRTFGLERFGIQSILQQSATDGHWASLYMAMAFDSIWLNFFGLEGAFFMPQTNITRGHAVVLLNHYTGRVPNEALIRVNLGLGILRPYSDLTVEHFAFWDIMSASMSKTVTQ